MGALTKYMTVDTRLIFVRHGDAVITQPEQPRTLTPLGMNQARAAAAALADRPISQLWSSSMARAEQTAAVIGESLGRPIQLDDRLRERKNEDPAPGVTAADDDPAYVLERLRSMVADVVDACRGRTALLVTHAGITGSGLVAMCGNLSWEYVAEHPLGNCSISEIMVDRVGNWVCLTWDGRPIVNTR